MVKLVSLYIIWLQVAVSKNLSMLLSEDFLDTTQSHSQGSKESRIIQVDYSAARTVPSLLKGGLLTRDPASLPNSFAQTWTHVWLS